MSALMDGIGSVEVEEPVDEVEELVDDFAELAERAPTHARLIIEAMKSQAADTLRSPGAAAVVARQTLYPGNEWVEEERLACLVLDKKHSLIAADVLTTGDDQFTLVSVRKILRYALTRSRPCAAIILAHNHPSGRAEASTQDWRVTRMVREGCRAVGIRLLDHLVITLASHASCAEHPDWPIMSQSEAQKSGATT